MVIILYISHDVREEILLFLPFAHLLFLSIARQTTCSGDHGIASTYIMSPQHVHISIWPIEIPWDAEVLLIRHSPIWCFKSIPEIMDLLIKSKDDALTSFWLLWFSCYQCAIVLACFQYIKIIRFSFSRKRSTIVIVSNHGDNKDCICQNGTVYFQVSYELCICVCCILFTHWTMMKRPSRSILPL